MGSGMMGSGCRVQDVGVKVKGLRFSAGLNVSLSNMSNIRNRSISNVRVPQVRR